MEESSAGNKLSRRLGLFSTTTVGVGVILGAGIYVLVGIATKQAGNAAWLSFVIAAIVAGLTGLSYARLSRLKPKNAPEFQYLNMAFGRTPAFLAGWLVLWATIISSAAVALGFGGYLEYIFNISHVVSAIMLVVISSIVVFWGVGESAILAGVLTFIEIVGLMIIVVVGIPSFGKVNLLEMPQGFPGVFGAASLVFFAYLGFEGMANLSEEMKNPGRDLPRAILLALVISTAFYILVSISAVSVLGWQALSQSSAPLAEVASKGFGKVANSLLTGIALASTANTVLLLLFTASRAMWGMACARVLPMKLCTLEKTRRTPWLTIIIVGTFALIFTLIRNIEDVAEYTNFATLLAFIGVNASAFKIFSKDTSGNGIKHLFKNIILPLLGCAASLWLAIGLGWSAALFGSILLVAGIIVHLVLKRLQPNN